jgi:PPM family protein phosphatase
VTDLQQSAQLRVREGFEEDTSLDEARADIRRLRFEQMLPPCPREGGQQPGTSTVPTTTSQTGQGGNVVQPGTTAPPTLPPPTSASTTPPVPGRDCR